MPNKYRRASPYRLADITRIYDGLALDDKDNAFAGYIGLHCSV
jgi:hypothetical protein